MRLPIYVSGPEEACWSRYLDKADLAAGECPKLALYRCLKEKIELVYIPQEVV
jgi:hypothetical protein